METGYKGTKLSKNGTILKNVGNREKWIHSLFGLVKVKRSAYAKLEKNTDRSKMFFPLDNLLSLGRGYTPACQYFLSLFTGNDVYENGVKRFNEIFRSGGANQISLKKAIGITNDLGEQLETLRQTEIEKVNKCQEIKVNNEITHMAVSIDATKTREILGKTYDSSGNLKFEVGFKDAKIATISEIKYNKTKQEAHCINTSYVAAEEHADVFFHRVYTEMVKRGKNLRNKTIAIIGDGAPWIWDRVPELHPDRVEILDFYHASEHLSNILKELYGEGSEKFKAMFKKWSDKLYMGKAKYIITQLEKLIKTKRGALRQMLKKEINYLSVNKERMQYDLYRIWELPIGSGTVESACKNLVGSRMKRAGMKWSKVGADSMLQIRASLLSDRLKQDFEEINLPVAA